MIFKSQVILVAWNIFSLPGVLTICFAPKYGLLVRRTRLRKNIFYLTSILLIIFCLGLNNISFANEKQEPQKVEKQENKKNSPIEIFIGSIAGITAKDVITKKIPSLETPDSQEPYYVEYGVETLESATYGDFVVNVFSTKYPNQAYGLYTLYRDPLASPTDFGTEGDLDVVEGKINFWQGTRFIQIEAKKAGSNIETMIKLAEGVSEKILALDKKTMVDADIELAKKLPGVIRNLPEGTLKLRTARYILGPEALKNILGRDITQYDFYPNLGTEIAYASYEQDNGKMSFLIIEHHTPQQSIAAFKKLNDYQNSLPEIEKNKVVLKREGNYIVEADNVGSVEIAKKLVDDVKYGYVVKWLNDNTPVDNGRTIASEAAKTGKILTSVFGLIGVGLVFALIGGVGMGFLVFYSRRRKKFAIESFSDAGGMMRLNIDGVAIPLKSNKNLIGDGK